MSNPLAAGYSKKGRGESSPRPVALLFSNAKPLPQIVAGKAPRVALLKEVSARDLTAIFTAVIAEDASLLDSVQAAHPLLRAGFGVERTPFTQLDLLLGNHLPAAYGTGQWFRFCVLLSQLHRLPDGPGRAGNGLCVRVRFLPFGVSAAAPSAGGTGSCTGSIRVWAVQPARQSATTKGPCAQSCTVLSIYYCQNWHSVKCPGLCLGRACSAANITAYVSPACIKKNNMAESSF